MRRAQLVTAIAVVCVIAQLWSTMRQPSPALDGTSRGTSRGSSSGAWRDRSEAHLPPLVRRRVRGAVSDGLPTCGWEFSRYVASPFERQWAAGIATYQHDICNSLNTTFAAAHAAYLQHLDRCAPHNVRPAPVATCEPVDGPLGFPEAAFSYMEYLHTCTAATRRVFLEPLAGVLRHPKLCTDHHNYSIVVDKGYMVIDPWHAQAVALRGSSPQQRRPRAFFFDVGASTWLDGAGGESQQWFVSTYLNQCVVFDSYYMWDPNARIEQVYAELPGHLHPHVHYFAAPASSNRSEWSNPLNHILEVTTPEDFVVFKLDLDHAETEEALVETMLREPEVMRRVDHFFFEHHVNMEIMWERFWGVAGKNGTNTTDMYQNMSLRLFGTLRKHGVAAHSWV